MVEGESGDGALNQQSPSQPQLPSASQAEDGMTLKCLAIQSGLETEDKLTKQMHVHKTIQGCVTPQVREIILLFLLF